LLKHTFIHIQGIGLKTERNLWKRDILTWQDFLKHGEPIFSRARDQFIREELEASSEHCNDILFFRGRLSSGDMWRIFDAFKEKAV